MKRIFFVLFLSVILDILPTIFESWYIYSICKQIEVTAWSLVVMSMVPYRYLMVKSLLAIWVVCSFADIPSYFAWVAFGALYPVSYALKALLSVVMIFGIWYRDYDKDNDILDEKHFFKVSIIPNSPQNFLLSLFSDPVGGSGIYADGVYYHYRKGCLVSHDHKYIKRISSKYKIRKIRKLDQNRLDEIHKVMDDPKYHKWSILKNCQTVLVPIIKKRRRPLV